MNEITANNDYENVSFPALRPFQSVAHKALQDGFRAGHKNQLIMAPTGGGKTLLAMWVIHEALRKGKRVIFLCDRTTLINQTSEVADSIGLQHHGILQANHWRRNSLPFQIASVQTIAKRGYWPSVDLLVVDECHSLYSAWTEFAVTTKAAVIGLSGTPFSTGLGKIFTNLINATTMHELTKSGVLVPMRVFSCTKTNMIGAATAGGEWTDRAAEERGMEIIGDVVSEWIKFGENRKTIVFGSTIKHCQELCRQFINAGVMAAVFTSETTATEREILLKEYKKHDSILRVLISVEALAKGFDVKDVGCLCDCRPLRKSLSTAIQMWGRGLRSSPETNKKDLILLDFSGNIIRFAEDYSEIYFNGLNTLDSGEKLDKTIRKDDDEKEIKGCPSCGYKPFSKRCMSCGYEYQAPEVVQHQPGEMKEIMLGKKKLADDQSHLWAQLCAYARIHSAPEKQKGRASNLFKNMTGAYPPSSWAFDMQSVEVTNNVKNKITNLNMKWKKGRANAVR
jgi:superfamily II DNA or RNA helicase